jgi:hypothetical protein
MRLSKHTRVYAPLGGQPSNCAGEPERSRANATFVGNFATRQASDSVACRSASATFSDRVASVIALPGADPSKPSDQHYALAKTLARLSDKSRQEFKFIGLRPGEKLFEEVFYAEERVFPSGCEKIACTQSVRLSWPVLKHALDELRSASVLGKRDSILAHLRQIVPQFTYKQDQSGSMEDLSAKPSAANLQSDVQQEVLTLLDMSILPDRTRRAKVLLRPPAGGSPSD